MSCLASFRGLLTFDSIAALRDNVNNKLSIQEEIQIEIEYKRSGLNLKCLLDTTKHCLGWSTFHLRWFFTSKSLHRCYCNWGSLRRKLLPHQLLVYICSLQYLQYARWCLASEPNKSIILLLQFYCVCIICLVNGINRPVTATWAPVMRSRENIEAHTHHSSY